MVAFNSVPIGKEGFTKIKQPSYHQKRLTKICNPKAQGMAKIFGFCISRNYMYKKPKQKAHGILDVLFLIGEDFSFYAWLNKASLGLHSFCLSFLFFYRRCPGKLTRISTNPSSVRSKADHPPPGLENLLKINLLRPDSKNQIMVDCMGSKPTSQSD